MIKVENIETWGFEHAIRGMRNPMKSWAKSDSRFRTDGHNDGTDCPCECPNIMPEIGENDLDLMQRLYKSGTEHRKYMRQVFISMDITAPLYWWKEFDTYKVGTAANSTSTMHKIHAEPFSRADFSCERMTEEALLLLDQVIDFLELRRQVFLETKDLQLWDDMIQTLPSSYNQLRTVTMTYENAVAMIHQRENHKLREWREFVGILLDLPYMREIMEVHDDHT